MIWAAELQRAVYECLNGNIPARVFNAVPEPVKMPWVVIGAEVTLVPGRFETQDSDGSEETFYIHTFDDAKGTLRLVRIMAEVDRHLHDAVFDLGGVARAHLRQEFGSVLGEQQDDRARFIYHGTTRYRALIHGVVTPT